MGWVVEDIIRRERRRVGYYRADEWQRFLENHGLRVRFIGLPVTVPAILCGNTVYVRRGLTAEKTAAAVWHELGHVVCHVGNRRFWERLPLGHLIISKMERQASEFAAGFPIWD